MAFVGGAVIVTASNTPALGAGFYNLGAFWSNKTASGPATMIYRSVGPGKTAALACGVTAAPCTGSGNLTISGTTATFAAAMPTNVGVGDAIQYQVSSTYHIAFISGRTSSTVYTIQSSAGGTPTASGGAITAWTIYRAYTSLSGAIAGTENASFNAAVANFDTFSYNNNLVSTNTIWNIACYADATDTTLVDMANGGSYTWVTSLTNYLRVYTPVLTTEVGVSQRHNGTWAGGGYFLNVPGNGIGAIILHANAVRFEGLKIESTNAFETISIDYYDQGFSGSGAIYVDNNLVYTHSTAAETAAGLGIDNSAPTAPGVSVYAYNNIFFSDGGALNNSAAITDWGVTYGSFYIYNNTFVNHAAGLNLTTPASVKNNIVQGHLSSQAAYGTSTCTSCDYNLSDDSTVTSGGTHNVTYAEVNFSNAAVMDYRLASSDSYALGAGENLSLDPSLPFTTDVQNLTRATVWDIGASTNNGVKAIYRSVGPSNTTALACAVTASPCIGTGAVTISGTTATFAAALPNRVGVGDAIQYQVSSTWYIAFITHRTSSTVYSLQNAAGGSPTAASANTTWSIYRAYTSLAGAISEYQSSSLPGGGTENAAINTNVQNFDTWSYGRDMVTNNEQWNFALYGDSPDIYYDTFYVGDANWPSDDTHYLRLFTPFLPTDVGVTQRHSGTWSPNAYTLEVITNGYSYDGFDFGADGSGDISARLEGIQFYLDVKAEGLNIANQSAASSHTYEMSNCLVRLHPPNGADADGVYFEITANNDTVKFWNNLVYVDGTLTSDGAGFVLYSGTAYVYNNTFYNYSTGIYNNVGSQTVHAYNNIAIDDLTYASPPWTNVTANSDYNLTNDTSTSGGTHDITGATPAFVSTAANNYLLAHSDTAAKGKGTNLQGDPILPFSGDVQGLYRAATWDIGASMPQTTSTAITSFAPTASTGTSFTAVAQYAGDSDTNAAATVYYCDATNTPGCNAQTSGTSVSATRTSGFFTATVTGLSSPILPGHTLNLAIVATDADGISGTPMTSSVILFAAPNNPSGLTTSATVVNFLGDVTLNWTAPTGTYAGFAVAYQTGATAPANCNSGTVITGLPSTDTTIDISNLTAQTEYSFRLCAFNYGYQNPVYSTGVTISGASCHFYLTSGTTWTVPSDYPASSMIETIAGGGGGASNGSTTGGGGGGAGASSIVNLTSRPFSTGVSIGITVGAGGAVNTAAGGGNTWFCNATTNCASATGTAVVVSSLGGKGGTTTAGGVGGALSGGVGTQNSGGSGAAPAAAVGGGGGGTAGWQGNGGNAGTSGGNATNQYGGNSAAGDAGGTPSSTAGTAGGAYGGHGYGGGGAGGASGAAGGAAGKYGAGGGGAGKSGTAAPGAAGIIIISYTGLTCS